MGSKRRCGASALMRSCVVRQKCLVCGGYRKEEMGRKKRKKKKAGQKARTRPFLYKTTYP